MVLGGLVTNVGESGKCAVEGKSAIVVGAGFGLGRTVARLFARRGVRVAVVDVDEQNGSETVEMVRKEGGEATFIAADIRHDREVEAALGGAIRTFGRIDFACNSAACIHPGEKTADITESIWDQVVDVGLKGTWLCMKHEIRTFCSQGSGGCIVNIGSTAALNGVEWVGAHYAASKHGVVALTRTAAAEYATAGIRINAVCPGWLDGEFGKCPEVRRHIERSIPMRRFSELEEVAETILWMWTGVGARGITGQSIVIDGGLTCRFMELGGLGGGGFNTPEVGAPKPPLFVPR